jgi:peroxiredoxin (alkyl hydroperoxide reductase subunit C)
MVLIGKKFPSIDVKTTDHLGSIYKLNVFHEAVQKKMKVLLFWYPKDFTFVCPTELFAFQDKLSEFENRNCIVIGASCDTCESHITWLSNSKKHGGIEGITYPILSDTKRSLSSMLGILDEEDNVTYRATYLIDENGVVFHESVNDMSIGRNVDEYLRLIDAKNINQVKGEVCPANWKDGEDGMVATKEGVSEYFTSHQLKDI